MLIHVFTQFAAATCKSSSFFGLPTWYKYLPREVNPATQKCEVKVTIFDRTTRSFNGNDFLLIGLSVVDMLLRIAALVAVAFVLYGGIRYITSQGSPEETKGAQETILHALLGLIICIVASAVVAFLGNTIK